MIGGPFAAALKNGRTLFNQQVAEAQRRFPGFDTAAFSNFLGDSGNPVVDAVAQADPDRVGHAAQTVVALALDLTGHSLAGASPNAANIARVWTEVAPSCAPLLADFPAEVLGVLTNAIVYLEKQGTARPDQWLRGMAAHAPQAASLAELRALGQLLAWRAGVAHFRRGALEAAFILPAPLAASACDLQAEHEWPGYREQALRDPWHGAPPDGQGVLFGAFSGLGGDFAEPPQLRPAEHGFWVRSGERYFLLVADRFGALLHGASEEEFLASDPCQVPPSVALHGDRLTLNGREHGLDLPAGSIALVCNEHTLAITSSYTHAVRLLPLP